MTEQGPEDVVRQFLEAEARVEPTAVFTTGLLHTLSVVTDEGNVTAQVSTEHSAANVRSMRLRAEGDGRAIVDLDAFIVHHVNSQHGGGMGDYRVRGPVGLRRDSEGWKIASVVVDGISVPESVYEPVVERQLGGCELTLFAQPTKKGTCVFARVVNTSDQPLVVSEVEITIPYFRLLDLRWGAIRVPATVGPGESWVGVTSWTPLSLRKSVRARIVIAGDEAEVDLVPPEARPWSRRAQLRRINGMSVLIGVLLFLGLVNAILTDWRGLGFLGIALAIGGTLAAARGVILEVAGFRSSGSIALITAGVAATGAGCAIMLRYGLGWIGSLAIVGTLLFTMQGGFVKARYVRRQRSRQLETV